MDDPQAKKRAKLASRFGDENADVSVAPIPSGFAAGNGAGGGAMASGLKSESGNGLANGVAKPADAPVSYVCEAVDAYFAP